MNYTKITTFQNLLRTGTVVVRAEGVQKICILNSCRFIRCQHKQFTTIVINLCALDKVDTVIF